MKSFKEYLTETVVSSAEDISSDRVSEIAKQFHDEVLSKCNPEAEQPNCALTTRKFVKWAKNKGHKPKAILMSWANDDIFKVAKKRFPIIPDQPVEHIAPIIDNHIIDYTHKRFTGSNKPFTITPLKGVVDGTDDSYSKFGLGVSTHNEGEFQHPALKIGTWKKVVRPNFTFHSTKGKK